MKIKNLDQGLIEKNPLKFTVTIPFRKSEEQRWCEIRERLKRINPKYRILEFARPRLIEMMDELERLIAEHESEEIPTGKAG